MARRHKRKTRWNESRFFKLVFIYLAKADFTELKKKKEILDECGFRIRSKADTSQTARKVENAYKEVKALVEKEQAMQVARNVRRNKRSRQCA